ncbi:inactive ubiquitin carboxyl-terminal hydrolase MINDY-4B [Oncorhynchus nerka]|uniref:inactive ubiquitin carboxyl-terminal hydrolase MINDY-4B n=1 Tax=Oncorhynchus nerka TaxID=8023 RepID=UPI0031B7F76C
MEMDPDIVNRNTELDDILRQILELDKWRNIFNSHRLEKRSYCPAERPLERTKLEEESEDGTGRPPSTAQPPCGNTNLSTVPYSIPRALTVSPSLGGLPITPELAGNLRKILFGNTFYVFNYEWKKSFFKFREPYSNLSYALEAERGGSRAIQMVVQANIIKYLLFTRQTNSDCCRLQSLSEVGEKEQERALAVALTDILWAAGEERSATISLVTSDYCFTPHLDYKLDNFTERLQLFSFNKKEDVKKFVHEHIQCFEDEGSHGVILFLYSLIFSRTITRLREDLDCTTSHLLHLSLGNFVCRQALMNLLLTGRASPNVFNGTLQCGDDGSPLEKPLHGVLARSAVGYLHWSRELLERTKLPMVGSMLKTPKLPIWVCSINGTYSVLFSPNRSLLSDWKMEHLFHMYFYNGQPSQQSTALLTIDTHSHHWEVGIKDTQGDPEKRFPSVEMAIRTKWEGAAIDWNGTMPFF